MLQGQEQTYPNELIPKQPTIHALLISNIA